MKSKITILFFFLFNIISYSQINLEKDLKNLYSLKNNTQKKSNEYLNVLYNISVHEILLNNYNSAEKNLVELIKHSPRNYSAISKLVLLYMNKGDFKKASPYRKKITEGFKSKEIHRYFESEENLKKIIKIAPLDFDTYEKLIQLYNEKQNYKEAKLIVKEIIKANNLGFFKNTMKGDFCIEQFLWENYEISVHEKLPVDNEYIKKHLFYIFDRNEKEPNVKSIIGTERYSDEYRLYLYENQKYKYLDYNIKGSYDYPELKELVIKVLEEKMKKE